MGWIVDFADDTLNFLKGFPWLMLISLLLYLGSCGGLVAAFLLEGQWTLWLTCALAALCLNRIERLIFMHRMDK